MKEGIAMEPEDDTVCLKLRHRHRVLLSESVLDLHVVGVSHASLVDEHRHG